MSLVHEYLRKTQEEAPVGSKTAVVHPVFTSSSRVTSNRKYIWVTAFAIIVPMAVILTVTLGPGFRVAKATAPVLTSGAPINPETQPKTKAITNSGPSLARTEGVHLAAAAVRTPSQAGTNAKKIVDGPEKVVPKAGSQAKPKESVPARTTTLPLAGDTSPAYVPAQKVTTTVRTAGGPLTVAQTDLGPPIFPTDEPAADKADKVGTVKVTSSPASGTTGSVNRPAAGTPVLEDPSPTAFVSVSSRDVSVPAPNTAAVAKDRPKRPAAVRETQDAEHYYAAGMAAQSNGEYALAEKNYLAALRLSPSSPKIMINLSAVYIEQGKLEEASRLLLQAKLLEPYSVDILVNLGLVDSKLGRTERAKGWFEQALQLNPDNLTALTNAAYLAQKENNLPDMDRYLKLLVERSPRNVEIILSYASVLEKKGNYSEARDYYKRCLDLNIGEMNPQLALDIRRRLRLLAGYEQ